MRKKPWKTGLAIAAALIAILFALMACASESGENLRATLASEQGKLESANQDRARQPGQGAGGGVLRPSIGLDQRHGAIGSA